MTTSSLRTAAAVIALIFAVLTGLFTGMVGGGETCTVVDQPSNQDPGQNQEAPGTGRRGGSPGSTGSGAPGQPGQDPGQGGDPTQPGPGGGIPGNEETPAENEINPETDGSRPLAQPGTDCESNGFSLLSAVVGFLGVLLAAGAVAALAFARRRDTSTPRSVSAVPDNGSATQQSEGERSTLVQTCIYVRDRATSKALQDRLGWALQEVGVATVSPTGVPFDPSHHEAGGSAVTKDRSKVGMIAAVEVPGYVDRGVVLRAPVVTVYRQDGQ